MLGQPSIFISYATPDRDRVEKVYDYLLASGYAKIWIDFKNILGGQRWDFEIKRNLQKADIVLVFFSKNSLVKRGYVQKELKLVVDKLQEKLIEDIYIIPIRLDSDIDPPELLAELQWIDINIPDSLNMIKESLNVQIGKLGLDKPPDSVGFSDNQILKKVFQESWDGIPGYEVEYSIPEFYSKEYLNINEITKIIEANFINVLHEHRNIKLEQMPDIFSWAQHKGIRTTSYDASFGSIYQTYNLISFHYTIHYFGAGAAHPNYHFKTYNFFLEPLLPVGSIKNIFEPRSNINEPRQEIFFELVSIVREELIKEYVERINSNLGENITVDSLNNDILEWIESGTNSWDDLGQFTFSNEGITIYFSPYQISSYSMGAFVVDIPYSHLPKEVKKIFKDALPIDRY